MHHDIDPDFRSEEELTRHHDDESGRELAMDASLSRLLHTSNRTLAAIAILRLHAAALCCLHLLGKANFDPNQPHVPAGRPDGGQWTASPGVNDGARAERPRLVQTEPGRRYNVDLYADEGIGHTIAEHVGRSSEYLRQSIADSQLNSLLISEDIYRASLSFSFEDIRKLINATSAQNSALLDQINLGNIKKNVFITAIFSSKTGIKALLLVEGRPGLSRSDDIASIIMRDTYGVGLVIRHDPTAANGFRVISAYPRND